ncbi:hypothetical protein SRABI82_05612 [Priestia megaterium]|nr:hypothetical protein SRABI82_05612 [Priestia megaterium]
MTGNLSRAVLRGADARESACLPDLTNFVYDIQLKKRKHPPVWMFFLIFLLQFLFC